MIELIDVKKSFGKDGAIVEALRGINLSIKKNEMVAIMGKSGSGKSTLLNIIGTLISLDSGVYKYNDEKVDFSKNSNLLKFRRNNVGFVVQYFALIEDMTVYENIALPLKYQKFPVRQIKIKVMDMLDMFGIREKEKAYPNELSGGQQQRVAIARALVKGSDILLADEPTGALDEQTEAEVLDVFKKLHNEGKTIVIVTHDENVAKYCDRIIHLSDGMVVS